MIPHKKTESLLKTNIGEAKAFTIEANAFSFEMLIDKLYSKKEESVVREIVANGVDATIEAGVPFPVEVAFKDNNFVVRDYGVGMSHDFVMENYSRLFDSTKRESNKVTGMIGLGSKSPFAIARSFTVTCFTETNRRVYQIYLDEQSVPHITLAAEIDGDFTTGVEVSIPVPQESSYSMSDALELCAKTHFDSPVLFTSGVRFDKKDVMPLTLNTSVWADSSYGAELFIRQGSALYRVSNDIEYSVKSALSQLTNRYALMIDVPIGTFAVTPSREALSLDTTSKELLQTLFKDARDEIKAQLADVVKSATSYDEMLDMVATHFKRSHDKVVDVLALVQQPMLAAMGLTSTMGLRWGVGSATISTRDLFPLLGVKAKRMSTSRFSNEITVKYNEIIAILPHRLGSYKQRINQYINEGNKSPDVILFVNKKHINALKKRLPFKKYATLVFADDLPKITKVQRQTARAVSQPYAYMDAGSSRRWNNATETTDAPTAKDFHVYSTVGGYFLHHDKDDHKNDRIMYSQYDLNSLIGHAVEHKIIPSDSRIYLIRSSQQSRKGPSKSLYVAIKKCVTADLDGKYLKNVNDIYTPLKKAYQRYWNVDVGSETMQQAELDKNPMLHLVKSFANASSSFDKMAVLADCFKKAVPECFEEVEGRKDIIVEALVEGAKWYGKHLPFALFSLQHAEQNGLTEDHYMEYIARAKLPYKIAKKLKNLKVFLDKEQGNVHNASNIGSTPTALKNVA